MLNTSRLQYQFKRLISTHVDENAQQHKTVSILQWQEKANAVLLKPKQDSIRFYFLCRCCQDKVERIGGETVRDETVFFV